MNIYELKENKKAHIDLLLLADEDEGMIDKYLDRGTVYVLEDDGIKGICVVTDEGNGDLEIKNIATKPTSQKKGYGKTLINFVKDTYKDSFKRIIVGTGDSPLTIPFYEKCGFTRYGKIENFFTDNYDHPIIECGVQLVDMIYLEYKLN